jgi:transposase-like protein
MKVEFDMKCPHCGHTLKQRVEALRPGRSRTCPSCRAEIRFTGDDGQKAQRALDDLERSIKNLSIKLRF